MGGDRGGWEGAGCLEKGPGKLGSKAGMSQSVSKYLFSARQLGGSREIIRYHPVPGCISGRVPRLQTRPGAGACPAPVTDLSFQRCIMGTRPVQSRRGWQRTGKSAPGQRLAQGWAQVRSPNVGAPGRRCGRQAVKRVLWKPPGPASHPRDRRLLQSAMSLELSASVSLDAATSVPNYTVPCLMLWPSRPPDLKLCCCSLPCPQA